MKIVLITVLSFFAATLSLHSEPIADRVMAELSEPPSNAKLGKLYEGIQIGLWTEKSSYQMNEVRNIWILAKKKVKSSMSIGVGGNIYNKSFLGIYSNGNRIKNVPMTGPIDGVRDPSNYAGGVSSLMSDLPIGKYELVWKVGKLESNVIQITIISPN